MKFVPGIFLISLIACNEGKLNFPNDESMPYSETEILEQFDLGAKNIPNSYYPKGRQQDIRYNFFLDLEDGYLIAAGNKIHLYADDKRWAVVMEQSGYHNRSLSAEIQLFYFGNCISYDINPYPERNYISNLAHITLVDFDEFKHIENKQGSEEETFEYIAPDTKSIQVRDSAIAFVNDYKKYEALGIIVKSEDNPRGLISFSDLIRYWQETRPELISARESDIHQHIPSDLPKLMTIDQFHFISNYSTPTILPSQQETYQLIAKVLVTKNKASWKPTLKPNNHWRNWESGSL